MDEPSGQSKEQADEQSAQERRDFFRVNHEILFNFKSIDSNTANQSEAADALQNGKTNELIGEFHKIDHALQGTLKILCDKDRELGNILQKLNQKIDLIARSAIFNQEEMPGDTDSINLSEGGIAFQSDRALYKGNYLVMRLIFLPSFIPVILFGKVIRCDQEENENTYQIATSFHRLKEPDRKELSRQIMRAQIKHRK